MKIDDDGIPESTTHHLLAKERIALVRGYKQNLEDPWDKILGTHVEAADILCFGQKTNS